MNGGWGVPWEVADMVEEIQQQIHKQHIHIQHIFREGNQLANYIANLAKGEGTTIVYKEFKQVPKQGRQIININKT